LWYCWIAYMLIRW